jgi:HK97 gp10 family phage protein
MGRSGSLMDFDIQLSGLDGLSEMLDELTPSKAVKVLRDAVKAGDDVFAQAVRLAAPELKEDAGGNALPPGFLKADITTKTTIADDGAIIGTIGPGNLSKHVATWVESGHSRISKSSGKKVTLDKPTPAYPFIRPAFEESATKVIEVVEKEILDGLKRAGVPIT